MDRLTPFAKILIIILIFSIVGAKLWGFTSEGYVVGEESAPNQRINQNTVTENQNDYQLAGVIPISETPADTIRISLDEWVGWKPLIDANGGLRTQPGSINYNLGIDVEYVIINDATQSANSLVTGQISGAGYTINRYAFLYNQFVENGLTPVMTGTLYASSGGDGVIANTQFTSIESLYGKSVGVARFSEAMALFDWLIDQSSLTEAQRSTMKNNLVMFDTPDDAARAFFAGRLDAAITWQPYLSQAQSAADTHLLFSTQHATNLITGGIVFDYDFVQANEFALIKLKQGFILAYELYLTEFGPIREAMPMFSLESDIAIAEMAEDATILNYRAMIDSMSNGIDQLLFAEMSDIWASRGESASRENADNAFTDRIINRLEIEADAIFAPEPEFTAEDREQVEEQVAAGNDTQALLTMRADILFEPNTAIMLQESISEIEQFVATAQLINGAIILVEGNVANISNDAESTPFAIQLSEERAREVAKQMQLRGISASRMVIVGRGIENQIASNDTEEGRVQNRRTDVSFVIME